MKSDSTKWKVPPDFPKPRRGLPRVPRAHEVMGWAVQAREDHLSLHALVTILNAQEDDAWNEDCERTAILLTQRYVERGAERCELYNACIIGDGEVYEDPETQRCWSDAVVTCDIGDLLERRLWMELTGKPKPLD